MDHFSMVQSFLKIAFNVTHFFGEEFLEFHNNSKIAFSFFGVYNVLMAGYFAMFGLGFEGSLIFKERD
jgi:hypothetical protein